MEHRAQSESLTSQHSAERAGVGDAEQNAEVERAAVKAVTQRFVSEGWSVQSVEQDKIGFDLVCTKGRAEKHVEVKGVRGTSPAFFITAGEVTQAREDSLFELWVVTSAMSDQKRKLHDFSGREFLERFELAAVQYVARLGR